MTEAERCVLAACFAEKYGREIAENRGSIDNATADLALDHALWAVKCFRQALKERGE